MPNWCANDVTLRHNDPALIQRAAEAYKQGRLLQEFYPCPQELYEGEGWYNWCVNHWGTKWDVGGKDDFIEQPDANTLVLSFQSAWAPPVSAFAAFEEDGFEVEAHYYEPGMCFFGSYKDGIDDTIDYSDLSAEEIRTNFPEADERWCISDWMEDSEEVE